MEEIGVTIGMTVGRRSASETATFNIRMNYKGRNAALPLTPKMTSQLAFEASFRDKNWRTRAPRISD